MRQGVVFQLVMSPELAERVRDHRFDNRLPSQSEAVRALIELGLSASKPRKAKAKSDAA